MITINAEKQTELIKQLVQRLPQIRREMNISQTDLGNKVGLSRQTISAVERGGVSLSWNNYLAIMMFIIANRDKCKTVYQDNSSELIEALSVIKSI